MITAIIYITVFLITCFFFKLLRRKGQDHIKRPPCLASLPIVGSLPFMPSVGKMHIFLAEKSKTLGNVVAFYLGNRYAISLNGREVIQEALVRQSHVFSDRPKFYMNEATDRVKQGLTGQHYGDQFKKFRRLVLKVLKTFGFGQGIMETRIKEEVDYLLKRFRLKNGQAFDPHTEITASVSNVINSIIFGQRLEADDSEFQNRLDVLLPLADAFIKSYPINFFPLLRFFPGFRKLFKNSIEAVFRGRHYISKIIREVEESDIKDSFFAAAKKEIKKEFGPEFNVDEQLIIAIEDLFVAGSETTATSLQWFVLLMANHQDVQKKIRNEIDHVVGMQRHPSLEDRPTLPLMEATLLELMRYRTLVPLSVPHCTSMDTYIGEMFISAGTLVIPNLYSCHMDPEEWDEPERFNIERFLDESKTTVIKKDRIIPFSVGKRSCFGEMLARPELFLFASALVHEFEIYPPEGSNEINDIGVINAVNQPASFKVKFIQRSL